MARRPAQGSIFDILPLELLELIVKHAAIDIRNRFILRSVCKDMQNLIDSRLFKATTVSKDLTQAKLKTIALGNSPHSRWTKQLIIEKSTPPPSLVVPLIEALKEVTDVEYDTWVGAIGPESREIVPALSHLPKLKVLSLIIRNQGPTVAPSDLSPFSLLSNLHSLRVKSTFSSLQREVIRRLFQASPTLTELALDFTLESRPGGPRYSSSETLNIDTLLSKGAPTPAPALITKLCLNGEEILVGASSIPYLRNLTHLELLNVSPGNVVNDPDAAFWNALSKARIHLKSLLTFPPTPSLVRYLTSYSGLTSLSLYETDHRWDGRASQDGVQVARTLFDSVLPLHCSSLKHLAFPSVDYRVWAVTDGYFDGILSCQRLETLCLSYLYTPEVPQDQNVPIDTKSLFVSMPRLLPRVLDGALPHLHSVTISPACDRVELPPYSMAWGSYELEVQGRQTEKELRDAICGVDLSSLSTSVTLRNRSLVLHTLDRNPSQYPALIFDHESRHFKPLSGE
ncbi:hypothetical protein DFP72DRAFT_629845 [Ephemerocybe angulata]|uniref:F-box domain-containing protein n=1 Tax=Ephemerocybe angulata TaxID=980116 RepID=A0A8H6IDD9_9AGAR|nr:hypothetical protein DFP72DRAFT_629845 [Tulosesus angulatus]